MRISRDIKQNVGKRRQEQRYKPIKQQNLGKLNLFSCRLIILTNKTRQLIRSVIFFVAAVNKELETFLCHFTFISGLSGRKK